MNSSLKHFNYDSYEILWKEPQAWFSFGTIKFESDAYGKVTGITFDIPNDDFFFDEMNAKIWDLECDIFAPCAASRLITKEQISSMIDKGLEVISCGANVPFADKEIFFGSIMEYTDERVSLVPDFISNCGMARVFAYFMERKVQMTDEAIFSDTSLTIKKAIQDTYNTSASKTNISKTAFEIALKQLV